MYNVKGLSSAASRCAGDEPSLLVQTSRTTFTSESDVVKGPCGAVVGRASQIDLIRTIEITGIINGADNLASNALNFALTLAAQTPAISLNTSTALAYHGFVSTQPIFLDEVAYESSNSAWRTLTARLISYLSIAS